MRNHPALTKTSMRYFMKAFNKFVKGYRKTTDIFGLLGAIGLFIMVAITFIDVFMRYFFKAPIVGSQEMVQFTMIVTMFGGMACAASRGMLISVDAVTQKFHPTVRLVLKTVFDIASGICAVLMCEKMAEQAIYYISNPMQMSSILKWSYAPFYTFAAIGLAFLSIEVIIQIVLCIFKFVDHGQQVTMGRETQEEGGSDK